MSDELVRPILGPLWVFVVSAIVQCLAAVAGYLMRAKARSAATDGSPDLDTAHAAALTLLALVIGFTFSMAVSRYDQRKNYEEEEANAIGTEYARALLLPKSDAAQIRAMLTSYTDKRIRYYVDEDEIALRRNSAETAELQDRLWAAVLIPSAAHPTPVTALAVSGMNDVLNSQGYTQAAWLNRIPLEAWVFLELIAAACNVMFGFRYKGNGLGILFIFPIITASSFLLISDIDTPRRGIIHVVPQNLVLLSKSLGAP